MEKERGKNRRFYIAMIVLLILQISTAVFFCTQKKGFHYDEYYSYYSSNITYGLVPTDMEWKDTEEIKSEFMVLLGERFRYGLVSLMQTYDVHPPLYYLVLHTVCSLTPGVFSKWQGLSVNLFFFVLSWILMAAITDLTSNHRKRVIFAVCACFGFSPAVFSGITFIRMYMMLTCLCFLLLYIHIRAIHYDKRNFLQYYIPILIVTFLGFLTHYYFAVFLFFAAAATFLFMIIKKDLRRHATCYAASVAGGLLAAVVVYPSCLAHIFRGYRGTEAMDAFFDIGNITQRLSFFFGLTNEYVFGNTLYFLILTLLLLAMTCYYFAKRKSANTVSSKWFSINKRETALIAITTIGYFLVAAKTALLNAEEAIRYEMPIYGLLILLFMLSLDILLKKLEEQSGFKKTGTLFGVLLVITVAAEIFGLCSDKVQFLYREDEQNVVWASNHGEETIVYLYNPVNEWMIWDDAEELMQYDRIFFVSMENENPVADESLLTAEHIYVYAARSEKSDAILQNLKSDGSFATCNKIRELRYCDLYELK